MSDVTPRIINLYPFSAKQEKHLYELRRDRVLDAATGGDLRPDGARLSIDCPVRRVKALFDPLMKTPFPEGVGRRGHLMEDMFEVAVLANPEGHYAGAPYSTQVVIPWGPTELDWQSAFDMEVDLGDRSQLVSIKSSTESPCYKLKPSRENKRQEDRMMTLHGCPVGTVMHFWMVHPGSMQVIGPFEHELTAERHAECLAETAGVVAAYHAFAALQDPIAFPPWNDEEWWKEAHSLECACGGCIKRDVFDANAHIEARVRRMARLRDEKALIEEQLADLETGLKDAARLLLTGTDKKKVRAHSAPFDFSVNKNDVMSIRQYKDAS